MISLIVARAENNVIGSLNKLPWYIPRDLKHFSATTKGHTVIMGRNTYLSIVERNGKPLPERNNIVVSRQTDFSAPGCTVVSSLDEALTASPKNEELFIIGGAQLYAEAIAKADKLYITQVHAKIDGDAFFPEFSDSEWNLVNQESHDKDDKNQYASTFLVYERRK